MTVDGRRTAESALPSACESVDDRGSVDAAEETLRRDIGRGVMWAAASNVVMRIAGICVTAVVARILSPGEFGVFAIALAVFVVVTSLAELGMASAVARSPMEPHEIAGTVTSISIGVSFSLATAMALGAGPLATVLGVPDAAGPIRVLSICLALTGVFSVPGALLTREFRQDKIFRATLAGFVPANAVLIGLALLGEGAMAFAWSRVVGQVVTGLLFVAATQRRYRPEWRRELVGPLLRFGLPLSLANLINWTLLNADYLIIGRMVTAEAVGVYMIAFTVASWSTAVLGSVLNGVVVPAFGRVAHDAVRLREQLVAATRLVALVALPIAMTSLVLAPSLVHTVFGDTWADAAPVLGVLALYGACFAFTLLFANVLVATGATRALLLVQVAWVVALVPAMVVGIRMDGLVGAAWAHVVVVLLVAVPGYAWAMRSGMGGVPVAVWSALVGPAAAAGLAATVAWSWAWWWGISAAGFVGGGLLAVLVYLVAAGPMIEEALPEVRRWRSLVRRVRPVRAVADPDETSPGPLGIGIVLEGLALGGCPINAIDLARTLRSRGHRVHVFAVDEDVRVSLLPYAATADFDVVLLSREAGLVARARQLRRHARDLDLDVIHVFAPWLARAAVLACGLRGDRVAITQNWMMQNEYPTTPRTPLVVGTEALREEAVAQGHRAHLLEPPVDLARDRPDPESARHFRTRHGLASDDVVLVLIGRVDRVMKLPGILLAIDAVAQLDDPSLRLVVVGDGNAIGQVETRVAAVNEGLGRAAVVLTGSLGDPHPAYAAADVGLAMGGSAIRVLAHGCPLVVLGEHGFTMAFTPRTAEAFLRDGFYGTDGPAAPVRQLVDQITELLREDRRQVLGDWGRELVSARYGLESAASRLELIYRDTLGDVPPMRVRLGDVSYLAGRHALGVLRQRAGRRPRATP